MSVKIYTVPAQEPITLTQFKEHCRIDSGTFGDDVGITQLIKSGAYTTGTVTGTGVNVSGYNTLIVVEAGVVATGGSVSITVQESDDNSLYTNVTGGLFTAITPTNDESTYEYEYQGVKTYVRVIASVTGTANFSVVAVKGAPTSAEDNYLMGLITSAREYVESITNRAILTQTWDLFLDDFPYTPYPITLPFGNLQTVTHVKYTDAVGITTTMVEGEDYLVDYNGEPARIVPAYGKVYPIFVPYPVNPVQIRFVCGWTSISAVKKSILQAIMIVAAELYEQREETIVGLSVSTVKTVDRLLANNRLWGF